MVFVIASLMTGSIVAQMNQQTSTSRAIATARGAVLSSSMRTLAVDAVRLGRD